MIINSIDPAAGYIAAGAPVTVVFTINEAAAVDPMVTLGGLPMTKLGQSGLEYTYQYITNGGEGSGTKELVIYAAYASGSDETHLDANAMIFDFLPPTVVIGAPTPPQAAAGTPVQVVVTVTDPHSGVASVAASLGGSAMTPQGSVGDDYTFRYSVTGAEAEGGQDIQVDVSDHAGNSDAPASLDALVCDFSPPDIGIGDPAPTLVKAGEQVTVVATVTDVHTAVAAVTATIGGAPMTPQGSVGDDYTFNYITNGGETQGLVDVVVSSDDEVGNGTSAPRVGAVRFDFDPPAITVDSVTPSAAKAGTLVTVLVTATDGGSGVAMVTGTLGGLPMAASGPVGNQWTLTRTVTNGPDTEGGAALVVTATDAVGNVATESTAAAVIVDFTPPIGQILVEALPDPLGPIPAPEPLNRYAPGTTLHLAVRVSGLPIDLGQSRLQVGFSPTGYGAPDTTTIFDEALSGVVLPSGDDFFAGAGTPVTKRAFTDVGYYAVTATLQDPAGNPAAPPVTEQFRTRYPVFSLRQGYAGASWNSPDILMWSDATFQAHYAPPGYPVDQGTERWQFVSNEDNYVGLRIRNTGNEAGDCKYRIFCVPGAVFTSIDSWKLITTGSPAPVEAGISPPGTPGGDHEGYRVTAGTNYNDAHSEWPDWTPPPANPDQVLHTCVCGMVHGSEDPLVLRDAADQPVVVTDEQFDSPSAFRDEIMEALTSYPGTGAGYWNAVHGNDKIANINFHIKVVAAGAGGGAGAGAGGSGKKAEAIDELPFPKEPFIPADLPEEWRPQGPPKGFHYAPWLHDKVLGWTPAVEKADPRPVLAVPGYFLERHVLLTRGLRRGKRNELELDRGRFPRGARVFCRLPEEVLDEEQRERLGRLRPGQTLWKGTRLADPRVFDRLFPPAPKDRARWLPLEIVASRAVIDGLRLTERPVWLDVAFGVREKDLRPKTAYVMAVRQRIDGKPAGNFDFHLRAYHPYDVPVVGDRRTRRAFRRTNAVVAKIPASAIELFDALGAARAAGYRLDPRDFGPGLRPELPDKLVDWLMHLLKQPLPGGKRLDGVVRSALEAAPAHPWIDALRDHPELVEGEGPRPENSEILRLLGEGGAQRGTREDG